MTAPRQLNWNERTILAALTRAAAAGVQCPFNEDLDTLIGASSASTSTTIVKRLENWGLIRVERYQRERRVTIVKTGKATAEVRTKAPHWRHRPQGIPAPAAAQIKTRSPDIFAEIQVAANREGRAVSDFLADLAWMGWNAYREDRRML